jgi:hypothetical protein
LDVQEIRISLLRGFWNSADCERKERRKVGGGSMTSNSKIVGVALTLFGCISIAMSYMYPWQGYYGYPLIVVTLVIAGIVCLVPGVMLWRREAKSECQRKFTEGR